MKADEVGSSLARFRMVKYTKKGNRLMAYRPFRLVYRGSGKKAQAKKRELVATGFAVRVVRQGSVHYVYAHTEGRGKWKYQPADRWFDLQVRKRKGAASKKRMKERVKKQRQRARKKTTASSSRQRKAAMTGTAGKGRAPSKRKKTKTDKRSKMQSG
jgi:hypothetical protein